MIVGPLIHKRVNKERGRWGGGVVEFLYFDPGGCLYQILASYDAKSPLKSSCGGGWWVVVVS